MDEDTLISLVIARSQRSRYRRLLSAPKKRMRLLDNLNHTPPLDSRWTAWYPSFTKALQHVTVQATTRVYLLSADADLDGQSMNFNEAIEAVPAAGWSTIIGISPLSAVYYGEEGERAAVIKKRT